MQNNRIVSRERAREMDLHERVQLEGEITDARLDGIEPVRIPADWNRDRFMNQSPWRKFMFESLGPLDGKTVLDLGCGYHPTPIYLALAGAAHVVAVDVSANAIRFVRELAVQNGVADRVSALQCPAEQIPLADEHVDLIHGEAVLHHVDIARAGPELARVLTRGGRAVFKDPLGQNRLLELARDYLPYPGKHAEKGTDHALTFRQCEEFGRNFSSSSWRGFGFLSMLSVPLSGHQPTRLAALLHRLDQPLLTRLPRIEQFCRFVVTCVEKAPAVRSGPGVIFGQ